MSAKGGRIGELERAYAELKRRYAEMVREGHERSGRLSSYEFFLELGDASEKISSIAGALQFLKQQPKPGRVPGKALTRAFDKEIADECLTKAGGNTRSARTAFIVRVKRGMSKKALKSGAADTTAERRWYEATESRRAKRK